ncbi:hypothetical protein [Sporosarcina sp. NPDC096371]|uniref:hypothetical protein n=1 Tax=Sporosarcina sp. NPDC096371 TaxID=3364530 RepID=UPI0038264511
MKKLCLIVILFSLLLPTIGCVADVQEQKITVQKQVGEDKVHEDFREISDRKKVSTAIEIVKSADWENAKIKMERYPDYQFQFPLKNGSQDKIASYLLWISPNGENVEIVTDGGKYVKLTEQDSATLYEILTGEALS